MSTDRKCTPVADDKFVFRDGACFKKTCFDGDSLVYGKDELGVIKRCWVRNVRCPLLSVIDRPFLVDIIAARSQVNRVGVWPVAKMDVGIARRRPLGLSQSG